MAISVSTVTMLTLSNPISKGICAHKSNFVSVSSCSLDSQCQSIIHSFAIEDLQNALFSAVTWSSLSSKFFACMVLVDWSLIKDFTKSIVLSERQNILSN